MGRCTEAHQRSVLWYRLSKPDCWCLGYPGALHKSFDTRIEAQQWLDEQIKAGLTNAKPPRASPSATTLKGRGKKPKRGELPVNIIEYTQGGSKQIEQADVPAKEPPAVVLNDEQQKILRLSCSCSYQIRAECQIDAVLKGDNLFLTGAGGTGKSVRCAIISANLIL